MIDTASPKAVQQSRAVLRRVEPGNLALCAHCHEQVKFAAKLRRWQVIANVYLEGRWDRVEHFHDECYPLAGEPYGTVAEQEIQRVKAAR